jgi:hypothetical protein
MASRTRPHGTPTTHVLRALAALPIALLLASCGGTSTQTAGTLGAQANLRFINGLPNAGAIDIYIQETGGQASGSPIVAAEPFGQASQFISQLAVASTIKAIAADTGPTGPVDATCTVPAFNANGTYDIVFAVINGTPNCALFIDNAFTGVPQVRFHQASGAAGFSTIDWGVSASAGTFSVLGAGTLGSTTGFTPAVVVAAASGTTSNVTFAIGTTGGAVGTTETALDTFGSANLLPPNTRISTNTSGALNAPGSAGTSLFALDCTAAAIALIPGAQCNSGVTLIGYTDSK